jgi:putative ABC transport system permease protein
MSLAKDVQFGLRGMRKNLGFTLVAVVTLALAIGANSAIFSVVNGVLLKPLPYDHPERIVMIWEAFDKFTGTASWPNFHDWQRQTTTLEHLSAFQPQNLTLQEGDTPQQLRGATVTADFFRVLGVQPILGRSFAAGEDQPTAPKTVVLGEGIWRTQFGANPGIIGQNIRLNGQQYNVIGVMPAWLNYPANAKVWIPNVPAPDQLIARGNHGQLVIARLKQNVSFGQAQEEMKVIAQRIAKQYPDTQGRRSILLRDLQQQLVGGTRPSLIALLVAVGFVLLIACANVANLMLARVTGRRREIAIRMAIGASRVQLLRQFLTESVLLSLVAGLAGLLIARLSMSSLVAWAAPFLPRAGEVSVDLRIVAFSIALATVTGLLCGLVPAFQSSKADMQDALKQGGTSAGSSHSNWVTGTLAIGEVAIAVVLLISAGLLVRSVLRLQQEDPGFQTENVITMKISLPTDSYKPEAAARFFEQVVDRVSVLPGVQSAGAINLLPNESWGSNGSLTIRGMPTFGDLDYVIERRFVTPQYFSAMNIPLVKGRRFETKDTTSKAQVAVINQSLAKILEQGGDPIGKIVEGDTDADSKTIIGVVGNVHQAGLNTPPLPEIYYLTAFATQPYEVNNLSFVVRAMGDPTSVVNAVRHEVAAVDSNQAIYGVKSMQEVVETSYTNFRFTRTLVTVFACLGTLLAVIGVYSVLAYLVTQHTREIGIRVAVGAQRSHIVAMVLNQAAMVGAVGVLIGLCSAFALTRFLSSMLFGVKAYDLGTFLGASALLFAVVLVACCVPAWRATRVDPMIVLRQD